MAIVTTDNQHYSDIADAIRAKGASGSFKPSEIAAAIAALNAGGSLVSGSITPTSAVLSLTITVGSGKSGFLMYNNLGYTATPKNLVTAGIKNVFGISSTTVPNGTSPNYPQYGYGNSFPSGYGVRFDNNGTVFVQSQRNFAAEEYKWIAW